MSPTLTCYISFASFFSLGGIGPGLELIERLDKEVLQSGVFRREGAKPWEQEMASGLDREEKLVRSSWKAMRRQEKMSTRLICTSQVSIASVSYHARRVEANEQNFAAT